MKTVNEILSDIGTKAKEFHADASKVRGKYLGKTVEMLNDKFGNSDTNSGQSEKSDMIVKSLEEGVLKPYQLSGIEKLEQEHVYAAFKAIKGLEFMGNLDKQEGFLGKVDNALHGTPEKQFADTVTKTLESLAENPLVVKLGWNKELQAMADEVRSKPEDYYKMWTQRYDLNMEISEFLRTHNIDVARQDLNKGLSPEAVEANRVRDMNLIEQYAGKEEKTVKDTENFLNTVRTFNSYAVHLVPASHSTFEHIEDIFNRRITEVPPGSKEYDFIYKIWEDKHEESLSEDMQEMKNEQSF